MDEDTFTKTAKNIIPAIGEIPEMTESDFEKTNQFLCQDTNGDNAFSEAECTHGFHRDKPYTLYDIVCIIYCISYTICYIHYSFSYSALV